MSRAAPVVYGEPDRIEILLDAVTRLVEREPAEVFADAGVLRSARELSDLVVRRTTEAAAARSPRAAERPHHP